MPQAKANTVSEQLDVNVELGGGIEGIITVETSFTRPSKASSTEKLTTIRVDCKDELKASYVN